jgi:acyl-coenzyme A thioesterase PaaI-like protein
MPNLDLIRYPIEMNVLNLWTRLASFPFGKSIFNLFFGQYVPYSGGLGARIVELSMGRALVQLKERRPVQNHLNSIHAVALMNLAEMTSGLALHAGMGEGIRAILVRFEIDFRRKARGRLQAEAVCTPPSSPSPQEIELQTFVRNETGEIVCEAKAVWKTGPKE